MATCINHQSRGTAPQNCSNPYPVDLVHLSRQTLGDKDLEIEVLGLFVKQSTLYLQRLQSTSSVKERKRVAHTIQGSAKGLGAWQVAEEAARFEATCTKKSDCKRLTAAVDNANTYIRELIC